MKKNTIKTSEKVVIWIANIINPVLAGGLFYFMWRKSAPQKAKYANRVSFIVFGLYMLVVVYSLFQQHKSGIQTQDANSLYFTGQYSKAIEQYKKAQETGGDTSSFDIDRAQSELNEYRNGYIVIVYPREADYQQINENIVQQILKSDYYNKINPLSIERDKNNKIIMRFGIKEPSMKDSFLNYLKTVDGVLDIKTSPVQ